MTHDDAMLILLSIRTFGTIISLLLLLILLERTIKPKPNRMLLAKDVKSLLTKKSN